MQSNTFIIILIKSQAHENVIPQLSFGSKYSQQCYFDPNLDDNIEDNVEDPPDIEKAVRIDLAHQAWKDANGQLAIRKAAWTFGISFSMLNGRIHGAVSKAQASEAMQ